MCADEEKVSAALEVDHIIPHRQDNGTYSLSLFWDRKNWQGLCVYHHRSVKAKIERTGNVHGNRVDGSPIDPDSHWHKE
jgi:5-methylcytosine-specific restriction endonuclease McrA